MDELEVYGMDSNQSSSQVTQYTFEVSCFSEVVCDLLILNNHLILFVADWFFVWN